MVSPTFLRSRGQGGRLHSPVEAGKVYRTTLRDILEGKFSALVVAEKSVDAADVGDPRWNAYRQNPQQRGLARILQADHRDIHLRRPVIRRHSSALHPSQ